MSAGIPCQDIEGLEVNQRKNVPHRAVICRRSVHARLSSAGVAVIISFTESHHQPSSTVRLGLAAPGPKEQLLMVLPTEQTLHCIFKV